MREYLPHPKPNNVGGRWYNSITTKRKGKPKMGKMKEALYDILNCEMCYGYGWLFYGNENAYDVETCQCNPHALDVETK